MLSFYKIVYVYNILNILSIYISSIDAFIILHNTKDRQLLYLGLILLCFGLCLSTVLFKYNYNYIPPINDDRHESAFGLELTPIYIFTTFIEFISGCIMFTISPLSLYLGVFLIIGSVFNCIYSIFPNTGYSNLHYAYNADIKEEPYDSELIDE